MKARKAIAMMPGYDGAIEIDTSVRITATRSEARSLRCRPGTFEWRYGRANADGSLYHAGCHYAGLWERAGTAAASSPDWMSEGGGDWKGLPQARAVAMDELRQAFIGLGKMPTARLTAYCVEGMPVSEIAHRYGTALRDMAAVLHQDLRACAMHFNYL